MRLSTALPLFVAGTTAADWLASVGLTGSNAGADFGLRRYWLPSAEPAVPRWATEAEWFAQYTAPAGRVYEAGGVLRADLAANLPRFIMKGGRRRLVIDGGMTNKVTARKHNPVDLAGVTPGGDAAATLAIINDVAALNAAGLGTICTNGAVYRLDNTAGTAAAYAVLDGPTGNTNPHVREVYARGSGDLQLQYSGGSGLSVIGVTFTLTSAYQRCTSAAYAPTADSQRLVVYAPAGAVVYFILPGLYDRAAPAPPYPLIGDALTAVYQSPESFRFPAAVEAMMGGGARSALVRGTLYSVAASMALLSFGAGSENDRWQVYVGGSPARTFLSVMTGGVSLVGISTTGGTLAASEAFGAAAGIAAGDYAVDDSKGAVATSAAAGALPAITRGYLGRRQDGGATAHGLYDLVAFWPTRVTNATLQTMAVAA